MCVCLICRDGLVYGCMYVYVIVEVYACACVCLEVYVCVHTYLEVYVSVLTCLKVSVSVPTCQEVSESLLTCLEVTVSVLTCLEVSVSGHIDPLIGGHGQAADLIHLADGQEQVPGKVDQDKDQHEDNPGVAAS